MVYICIFICFYKVVRNMVREKNRPIEFVRNEFLARGAWTCWSVNR